MRELKTFHRTVPAPLGWVTLLVATVLLSGTAYGQVTTLVSGQPLAFTLPSVSGPTLFTGLQIVVPSVPAGLTLRVVDPSGTGTFQLFMRFGQDIGLSGGSVISDFSSATGADVSINVPPSSVKAGTYFIAIGLITTGQAISGTITGTVSSCGFSISPANVTIPIAGGSGSLTVTSATGCPWTAGSDSTWLTVSPASGSGNGSVSYTAVANTGTSPRNGIITIGGKTIPVTQNGNCTYTVSPLTVAVPAGGGSGALTMTTAGGCAWTATSDSSWLTIAPASGSGNGSLTYTAAANTSSSSRTGTITYGGQTIAVTEAAAANCAYAVAPASIVLPAAGSSGNLSITTSAGCSWTAVSDSIWLTVTPGSGSGSGTVTYTAVANTGSGARLGAVTIGGQTTRFSQIDNSPKVPATGITNAASFATGLTPGSIITVFGTGLSNASGIVQATVLPLPTQLMGTSVTINGVPAPLFAIANVNGAEQVNLQVPYEVTEAQVTAQVVVNNNGRLSTPTQIGILAAQPGIFTVDGTAGAILHANGQLVSRSNPATPGEVVTIYATGLGTVSPVPPTGQAPGSTLSLTTTTPVVTLGGIDSEVQFSGLAPGFVGLYQINVKVPDNITVGNAVPVLLKIQNVSSQAGVTMVVAGPAN